jgi:hypothetical protein
MHAIPEDGEEKARRQGQLYRIGLPGDARAGGRGVTLRLPLPFVGP